MGERRRCPGRPRPGLGRPHQAGSDGQHGRRHQPGGDLHRVHRSGRLLALARRAGVDRGRPVRLHHGVGHQRPRPVRGGLPARADRDELGLRRRQRARPGRRDDRLPPDKPGPAGHARRGAPDRGQPCPGRVHGRSMGACPRPPARRGDPRRRTRRAHAAAPEPSQNGAIRPRCSPAAFAPLAQVRALGPERGVVAVAGIHPGRVREPVEQALGHVVDQRGEVRG